MKKFYLLFILLFPTIVFAAEQPKEIERFFLDAAAIAIPKREGWLEDDKLPPNDGVILRLNRDMPVAGAPRIDFYVQEKEEEHPTLKEFINNNLKTLSQQEKQKKIKITYRDQRDVTFNEINAVRLRYDYNLLGKKGQKQAISQVTYFFDRGDRLVMIDAFGLSELYLPLNDDIEEIIRNCLPITPGLKGRLEPIAEEAGSFFKPQNLYTPDLITGASQAYKVQSTTIEQIPSSPNN